MSTRYLTGVSTPDTRAAVRADLGVLATPASGTFSQRHHYLGGWAADNGLFVTPLPGQAPQPPKPELVARWWAWIQSIDPSGCLFATLPDVVCDPIATYELTVKYLDQVRALGFPVAWVLQDGVEDIPWMVEEILVRSDAVFVGGSSAWKLSAGARGVVAQAKARGLWAHMGRVNSFKRIRLAEDFGCDSADGTFLKYGRKGENFPRMIGWLDRLEAERPLALELAA